MDPFEGTLFRVNEDELTSEFTHFNLVIRLRKVKQSAILFITFLRLLAAPAVFENLQAIFTFAQERLTEQSQTFSFDHRDRSNTSVHERRQAYAFRCGIPSS